MKFAIRSDMEGLFGVVNWEEVIPGTTSYEKSREWLHLELEALCEGLLEGGASGVEIYDEHYYGLNVDAAKLPAKVSVIRGKPPYTAEWLGGIDSNCAGLILQGYHAMWGVEGGILPHTYEPDIQAIWINGTLVGEIGMEAAIAGEGGAPLLLLIGDRHAGEEARALVPDAQVVVVKEGRGTQCGICRSWPEIREEIFAKAKKVAQSQEKIPLLRFEPPIEMRIQLGSGEFRSKFVLDHPEYFDADGKLIFLAKSVASAWAQYWQLKDAILLKVKEAL